jgi:hypothetical protein
MTSPNDIIVAWVAPSISSDCMVSICMRFNKQAWADIEQHVPNPVGSYRCEIDGEVHLKFGLLTMESLEKLHKAIGQYLKK